MLCQCPKLTPLQSRFVASFAALVLLVVIYWSLSNPHLAYAAELDVDGTGQSRGGQDHNWHRIEELRLARDGVDIDSSDEAGSRTESLEEGSSHIVRQTSSARDISGNNEPQERIINASSTDRWVYTTNLLNESPADAGSGLPSESELGDKRSDEHLELRRTAELQGTLGSGLLSRRQSSAKIVYISINTCSQPAWTGSGPQPGAPPQITLSIARSGQNSGSSGAYQLDEGFANANISTDGEVDISVQAPDLPSGFQGSWSYELAVSLNTYYHAVNTYTPSMPQQPLFLIDTDNNGALLVTGNLTQENSTSNEIWNEWMNFTDPLPYTIFVTNANDTSYMGLTKSYCGLRTAVQVRGDPSNAYDPDQPVQMSMITRGKGGYPKEQFYLTSLNASSSYYAWLAMEGNGTDSGSGVVRGGGKIWNFTADFTTKSDGNCQLLFNLSFCDEVAYAVPSNPNKYPDIGDLRNLYDNETFKMWKGFNYSMMQIPCDTTSDAKYSLAKNCDDCHAAYKEWLCAVTIPRCEDFSKDDAEFSWLQKRNMGQPFFQNNSMIDSAILNQNYIPMDGAPTLEGSPAWSQTFLTSWATNGTRNPKVIRDQIAPGPYKEVLPCDDLCYSLVQSCPASLGFNCPMKGRGLERGYGIRNYSVNAITCSYLGAVYMVNGGPVIYPAVKLVLVVAGILTLVFTF